MLFFFNVVDLRAYADSFLQGLEIPLTGPQPYRWGNVLNERNTSTSASLKGVQSFLSMIRPCKREDFEKVDASDEWDEYKRRALGRNSLLCLND